MNIEISAERFLAEVGDNDIITAAITGRHAQIIIRSKRGNHNELAIHLSDEKLDEICELLDNEASP